VPTQKAPITFSVNGERVKPSAKGAVRVPSGAPVILRVEQPGAQPHTLLATFSPGEELTQSLSLKALNAKGLIFLESEDGRVGFRRFRHTEDAEGTLLAERGLAIYPLESTETVDFEGVLEGARPERWRLSPAFGEAYTLRFKPYPEGVGRLRVIGSQYFKVTFDGVPLGQLTFDNKQLAAGPHELLLTNERDHITLALQPWVYSDGWIMWELKREKQEWRLIHYGFKLNGEGGGE